MRKNPNLVLSVCQNIVTKVRLMTCEIEYFSKFARSKVAITMISICKVYGIKQKNEIMISIKFTQEELANLTGLNRVTVAKVYQQFTKEGIIRKEHSHIIVSDIEKLKSIIE